MDKQINWESLLTIQPNYYDENGDKNGIRSPFQKDRDKIVFSKEFRRMAQKTQVFPTHDSDAPLFFTPHNRLTHSIEVETVGRSLGYIFASEINKAYHIPGLIRTNILDPYEIANIVQAACLAHDLGNPPLGHSGERIINKLVEKHKDKLSEISNEKINDLLLFDGNALSFQIMSDVNQYKISFPTLATLVKYPWTSSDERANGGKFSVFSTEKDLFEKIFTFLGLKEGTTIYRHPLSYLMELADDICYAIIDLEDGVAMQLINEDEIKEIFADFIGESKEKSLPALRAKTINKAIYEGVNCLIEHTTHYTNAKLNHLLQKTPLHSFLERAKHLAKTKIYNYEFEAKIINSELGKNFTSFVENALLNDQITTDLKYSVLLKLATLTDEEVIKPRIQKSQ